MPMISLAVAKDIARAAFEEGRTRGVEAISVVVVDAGGSIRLAMRADSQGTFGVDTAHGKARTALGFRRSSLQLSQYFEEHVAATATITAATGGRFVPLGGGVLVQDAEGQIIGAAAVSGGAPDVDDEIMTAAVRSVGLRVPS